MPEFKAQKRVNVPPHIAYDVASDVSAYKNFLPLLEESTICSGMTVEGHVRSFDAKLTAGYGKLNLRESFVSRVVCDSAGGTVTATSQQAPFKTMTTVWSIRDVNGVSDVSISITYTLRNMMMQLVLAGVMEMAIAKVMAAFEARALSIHAARRTLHQA